MTPNQRLILALVVSFFFLMAYSAVFPPEEQVNSDTNESTSVQQNQAGTSSDALRQDVLKALKRVGALK